MHPLIVAMPVRPAASRIRKASTCALLGRPRTSAQNGGTNGSTQERWTTRVYFPAMQADFVNALEFDLARDSLLS